jgi:glycosyltransferase involved in cell wall biosynthesis
VVGRDELLCQLIRCVGEEAEVPQVLTRFPAAVIRSSVLNRTGVAPMMRRGYRKLFSHDRLLEKLLSRHQIAVLSHSSFLGLQSEIPAIGWIPDFQHVHYPDFFSAAERAIRDAEFSRLCRFCTFVLVSSVHAMKELHERYPTAKSTVRLLPFVAGFAETDEGKSGGQMPSRISEPYFYLPNQFWIHKNHRIVVEALRLLKASDRRVRVLASGQTADYRHPGFYDSFRDAVREAGLADTFILLGLVPRTEVGRLMRHAVAVINPSLYEGRSTTVEEAKSLGKRMILSDIPVHREQAPADGVYFNPHKPAELADVLWRVWSEFDPVHDQRRMQRALAEWPRRQAEFARQYETLVKEVLKSRRQGAG